MRTITLEINRYNRHWGSVSMFSELWVRQHLMSHDYFKKEDQVLWTDLSIAAHGFFLYYKSFVNEYFADRAEIDESIAEDIQWGIRNSRLICQVPYQKPVEKLEHEIQQYTRWIKGLEIEAYNKEAFACASANKQSITSAKIKRLFRWGYLEAQQLIPYSPMNVSTVRFFLQVFQKISKKEALKDFRYIEFDIEDGALAQWCWYLIKFNGERVHYKDLFWCIKS